MAANIVIGSTIEDFLDDGENVGDELLLSLLCRDEHTKVDDFWEQTVPLFTDLRYRRAFRVSRSIFSYLVDNLSPSLMDPLHFGGRQSIRPDKKIAMFLKYLGSKETVLDISQLFGVAESSFIKARRQVTDAISDNLLNTIIQWPNPIEYPNIAEDFHRKDISNFPNVIGALDGCHIPISTPYDNPNAYYNRKKFHSVILQAVCREDLRFTDVCVGSPGRMHDARVLRSSELWDSGINKCQQGRFHILGDAAYPLSNWLLTPYRNNGNLTIQQTRYNTALSRRRQVIERAFGMLKRRFRRLNTGVDLILMSEINKLVLVACILHNVCILQNDIEDFDDYDDNDENRYAVLVNNGQGLQPAPNVVFPINAALEGRMKRIAITNNL